MRELTLRDIEAAVMGGSILAAGGGGWVSHGRQLGELAIALGPPRLVTVDELEDDDIVVTASFVGAPAAPEAHVEPRHYLRTMELFQETSGIRIAGVISSENGSSSTVNGWLQAAMLGVPVVDAPCNGRAHPTGKMGSLGLGPDFTTLQVAAGGNPDTGRYVETVARGSIDQVPNIIRQAADAAGGAVAVARNPVPVDLLRERAAVGAIDWALRLGEAVLASLDTSGPDGAIETMVNVLDGDISITGHIAEVERETVGGFDLGRVLVQSAEGATASIHTCNEYLAVDVDGHRRSTFPDLIVLIDQSTGQPIPFGEASSGSSVSVLTVDMDKLTLGAGVWNPDVYRAIEDLLGVDLAGPGIGNRQPPASGNGSAVAQRDKAGAIPPGPREKGNDR